MFNDERLMVNELARASAEKINAPIDFRACAFN